MSGSAPAASTLTMIRRGEREVHAADSRDSPPDRSQPPTRYQEPTAPSPGPVARHRLRQGRDGPRRERPAAARRPAGQQACRLRLGTIEKVTGGLAWAKPPADRRSTCPSRGDGSAEVGPWVGPGAAACRLPRREQAVVGADSEDAGRVGVAFNRARVAGYRRAAQWHPAEPRTARRGLPVRPDTA